VGRRREGSPVQDRSACSVAGRRSVKATLIARGLLRVEGLVVVKGIGGVCMVLVCEGGRRSGSGVHGVGGDWGGLARGVMV
jgi:hypothetical protein